MTALRSGQYSQVGRHMLVVVVLFFKNLKSRFQP